MRTLVYDFDDFNDLSRLDAPAAAAVAYKKQRRQKESYARWNEPTEEQEVPEIELAKQEVYEAAMELNVAQEKFNTAVVNVGVARHVWYINTHPDEFDER